MKVEREKVSCSIAPKGKRMDQDLDDKVAQAIANANFDDAPIEYATGPMADRRVAQQFRPHGIVAPKDKLCASINRLVAGGIIDRRETGQSISGAGTCVVKHYPVVQLV